MLVLKHKLYVKLLLVVVVGLGATVFGAPQQTLAATITCPDGYKTEGPLFDKDTICADHKTGSSQRDSVEKCSGSGSADAQERCIETEQRSSGTSGSGGAADDGEGTKRIDQDADCGSTDLNEGNCRIVGYINDGINILSAIVGIVVTIMIIVGGIQYTAAGADPNTVAKAKKQIFNAIFALVAYGLTYALLQYLIPGGLL